MGAGILATNAAAVAGRAPRLSRRASTRGSSELERRRTPARPARLRAAPRRRRRRRRRARSGADAMSDGELVLVIPRASIMADPGWRGIRRPTASTGFEALVAREGRFQPRAEMEADRSWKQVIPYLVLRDGERYFLMRRTQAGGDARLHDRWSIGVGGHLNPGDGDLAGGLRREWREELARRLRARVRAHRPAQRRLDRRRQRPRRRGLRRRRGRPAGRDPRDRQADRRLRRARARSPRSSTGWRRGAPSSSSTSRAPTALTRSTARCSAQRCDTQRGGGDHHVHQGAAAGARRRSRAPAVDSR